MENYRGIKSLRFLKTIFKFFSPSWLACIPLAAAIAVVLSTATHAQIYDDPVAADPAQLQIILDSIFLLFC